MNVATALTDAGEGVRIRLTREALAYTLILLVAEWRLCMRVSRLDELSFGTRSPEEEYSKK